MGEMGRLPTGRLSPLAARVEAVLSLYDYEIKPAIDAIDAAVPGYGGLFDPETTDAELRAAVDEVAAADAPSSPLSAGVSAPSEVVLYVDGSARGNPGPAGAGAVLRAENEPIARLGCPVGSHTGNNAAEYAALHLGLDGLAARCEPASVEIRIDSMTVVNDVWGDGDGTGDAGPATPHADAIDSHLSALPAHRWTHLADSDPNPADSRATVAADLAALSP